MAKVDGGQVVTKLSSRVRDMPLTGSSPSLSCFNIVFVAGVANALRDRATSANGNMQKYWTDHARAVFDNAYADDISWYESIPWSDLYTMSGKAG
eukprot:COSAG01_NODE_179_length_22923_cov_25.190535_9_plen_95_part_00